MSVCTLFICTQIYAQSAKHQTSPPSNLQLPIIVPTSPSVAGVMRFEEVPIDYYTGQPDINIPLGNIPIHKNLFYPIVLRYNTQAIRVDERSGWTGTGFSLTSGGVISRTVRSLPDEVNSVLGKGIFHNNFSNFNSLSPTQKEESLWKSANGRDYEKLDTDYDLYQYNYPGGSGRFIIIKEFGSLKAVITESETNEKINLIHNSNFFVTSFEIIDTYGNIYTFNEHNSFQYSSISVSTSQVGNSTSVVESPYAGGGFNAPNAWYLKEVKLPNGEVLCTFTYQDVSENYYTPTSRVTNKLIPQHQIYFNWGPTQEIQGYNNSLLKPRETNTKQSVKSIQKYVEEVSFRDGSKVKYKLSQQGHPEYLPSNSIHKAGPKLETIEIVEPNGSINKRIDFLYETTPNNRLFLTQVKENYGSEILTYFIKYHNKENLPGFGDIRKDGWGYYHENSQSGAIGSLGVNTESSITGSIKSIRYPTGGKKEFVFESNTFSYRGNELVDPKTISENYTSKSIHGSLNLASNHLNQISSDKIITYIEESELIQLSTEIIQQVGQGINFNNHRVRFRSVSPGPLSGISTPPQPGLSQTVYNANDFYDDNGADYTFNILTGIQNISIEEGWYIIELYTPQPTFSLEQWNFTLSISAKYQVFELKSRIRKGGGIRIKEVLFIDEGVEQRKISYGYNDPTPGISIHDTSYSSGSFEFDPNSRVYQKGETHPFISNIFAQVYRTPTTLIYDVRRDFSEIYTRNTRGNYVGYKYVTRTETGNGHELFTYISPRDVQMPTQQFTTYPFKPQENIDYKRGKIINRKVFDVSGLLLQEEVYNYEDRSSVVQTSVFPFETQHSSCAWDQFYLEYQHYKDGNNFEGYDSSLLAPDNIKTCHSSSNGVDGLPDMGFTTFDHRRGILLPIEITNLQYYYTTGLLSGTITSTSKSEYNSKNRLRVNTTETHEAGDLVSITQKTNYPYDIPPSEFTQQEKLVFTAMVNKNIVDIPVYNEYKRNTSLLSKTKTIYSEFSLDNFQPLLTEVFKSNENESQEINFHSYDTFGNLTEISKKDGTHIVYIWGYNQSLPIAKIENATHIDINNSLISNIQSASDNDNDRTLGSLGNEGALRDALANLRTNPILSKAMITTFTYDPLIGVTSITDSRGQVQYYDYDDSNRLRFIKDALGNILQESNYHYKN